MADRSEEVRVLADSVLQGKTETKDVVDLLADGARRKRQLAAAALFQLAKEKPELLVDYIDDMIDALNRPEAQTRWECLEALTILVDYDARTCGKAIPEAEAALFDEESGPVRLGAMRFLCKLGATTTNRSEKVWPLIDEGIQCYHGDLEFNDMLLAVIDFSNGKLADDVKSELASRMSFDATNGKGSLQRKAQQIIDNLK
ncbi:MAG: hypothetical protein J6D25_02720 [Eggerthellaceae bacterium]|nr:hypothetical protein [Eggerthellaceae bacterium]